MGSEEERVPGVTTPVELRAHALSLQFYSVLSGRVADGDTPAEAVVHLQKLLVTNHVEDHITIALVEGHPPIQFKSNSEFGDVLLLELFSRCEYFPCPTGKCEFEPQFQWCKWLR